MAIKLARRRSRKRDAWYYNQLIIQSVPSANQQTATIHLQRERDLLIGSSFFLFWLFFLFLLFLFATSGKTRKISAHQNYHPTARGKNLQSKKNHPKKKFIVIWPPQALDIMTLPSTAPHLHIQTFTTLKLLSPSPPPSHIAYYTFSVPILSYFIRVIRHLTSFLPQIKHHFADSPLS